MNCLSTKIKILIVANGDFFSTYGGGQVYVKNIVDEMICQKYNINIFSFIGIFAGIERKNYKGVDLYEIGNIENSQLFTLIEMIKPDVIHAHSQKALLARIGKEMGVPVIITAHHGGITCPAGSLLNYRDEICHVCVNDKDCLPCVMRNTKLGLTYFYPWIKKIPFLIRLKIGRLLEKVPFIYFITPIGSATSYIQNMKKEWQEMIKSTDIVIAPSNAIAENMVLNGIDPEKIKIIPHGIPMHNLKKNIVDISSKKKIKFFYIGRMDYVKGTHVLLKAFADEDPNICELHLIGDIAGQYEQNLLKKYQNNRNIIFHGKVPSEEIALKIREYDVLIHPTICLEVFGLNIAESLAEGKPVIATRCGGAEMQVIDKVNGLLVSPNSTEELSKAMNWMIQHPEELKQMSKRAPVGVISIQDHVKSITKVYQAVLLKRSMHNTQ